MQEYEHSVTKRKISPFVTVFSKVVCCRGFRKRLYKERVDTNILSDVQQTTHLFNPFQLASETKQARSPWPQCFQF